MLFRSEQAQAAGPCDDLAGGRRGDGVVQAGEGPRGRGGRAVSLDRAAFLSDPRSRRLGDGAGDHPAAGDDPRKAPAREPGRSEERSVGEESRSRWSPFHYQKKHQIDPRHSAMFHVDYSIASYFIIVFLPH